MYPSGTCDGGPLKIVGCTDDVVFPEVPDGVVAPEAEESPDALPAGDLPGAAGVIMVDVRGGHELLAADGAGPALGFNEDIELVLGEPVVVEESPLPVPLVPTGTTPLANSALVKRAAASSTDPRGLLAGSAVGLVSGDTFAVEPVADPTDRASVLTGDG